MVLIWQRPDLTSATLLSPSTELPGAAQLLARHLESCEECHLWNVAADFMAFYASCFHKVRDCLRCLETDGKHTLEHLLPVHEKMFRHLCLSGRQRYTEARGALRLAGKGKWGITPRVQQEFQAREQRKRERNLAEVVGPAWMQAMEELRAQSARPR